ncbi:restriction endonuclease subunit S [Streptococcus sp. HMSC063B03]|uniref:restriction endonuclease subunit S n=1 Tax=Streptococcus sp. HMSC063B03 TaxID=1715107 RepID=UPI0008A9F7DC|nr:restriction endonuclease subunit S [Streptococcus sp. HMSC063B03]OHP89893.1 restriction endonuclease subunit S [Streptococcus sp. HMSC063B03]
MSEWKRYKLVDLLRVKHGWAFKGEFFSETGIQSILTPGNFYESGGFKANASKDRFYIGEYPKEYLCSKGDLIVAMTEQAAGLLGSTAIVPEDNRYLHNQRIGLISCNEYLNKDFAYYLFMTQTVRQQISRSASGTKVKHTSPEKIYEVQVYIPTIQTQRNIAKILTTLDKKIQTNNQINQELEAMAKTLYDYWFVQFDFPDQNGKPYRSSGGKMVYHPELKREIPEGWGVEKLKYFLTIKNGKDHKHLQDGKFAVYGSGGIMRTVADYLYSGESILFPRKGTLNNVMYVNEEFWTVDTMFYSEVNKNNSALYVFYSVKDIDFNKLNTGTGVPSMTSSILYDLNIIVPEENILEKFNTIVKQNYETIKLNNIQNQELNQLRDWLLPMLMNGQVII